jgi:hypothetical protein
MKHNNPYDTSKYSDDSDYTDSTDVCQVWVPPDDRALNTTSAFFQGILLISQGAVLLLGSPQSKRRQQQNLWNRGEIKRHPEVAGLS